MKRSVLECIRDRTKPETRVYVSKNLDVAVRVNELLRQKGWTQKALAKAMGKTESEVSRWLSGLHNITLKSIVKMETVLGAEILVVPVSEYKGEFFEKTVALPAFAEPPAQYEKASKKSNG